MTIVTPKTEVERLRDRLVEKVAEQAKEAEDFYAYYKAEHQAPAIRSAYSKSYDLLLDMSNSPFGRLVVDAIAERLEVIGVRATNDEVEDVAWTILRRNRIDAYQALVHRDALITGRGFVSVTAGPKGRALIVPESSTQVAVEYEPGSFRDVRAALKIYRDGNKIFATLYTPTTIYRWEADRPNLDRAPLDGVAWNERQAPEPNRLGAIPIVPFENRPLVGAMGRSELADLTSIIRRIDKLVLDMMLAAETSAFIQRYIIGAEIERDEAGNPKPPFQAAADRIWMIEDENAKIGQLNPGDLDGYLRAIDSQIAMLAAVSRVPAYYLYTQSLANPPSADSLRAGEAGLVFKVHERRASYGESWEQVTALALRIERPDLAVDDEAALEMLWKPATMENPSQMADRAVKAKAVDVPTEAVWEMLGATPTEVARWRALREREMMIEALMADPGPDPNLGAEATAPAEEPEPAND